MYRYVVDQEMSIIYDGMSNVVVAIDSEYDARRTVDKLNEPIEELQLYSAELHLLKPLTLAELINSHRAIREARRLLDKDSNEAFQDARRRAKEFQENAISHEYISIEKLKTMTMLEIANLIYEE